MLSSGRAKFFRAEVVAESNRILALVAGRSRTVTRFARNGYSLSLVTVTRFARNGYALRA